MRRILSLSALALAASLALTGCFAPPSKGPVEGKPGAVKPSGPDVAPATGETVTGNGYSFVAPKGWTTPTGVAKPAGVDTFVANVSDADGFADNLNVLLSPVGEVTAEQVESDGVTELKSAGATEVTVGERITVGGSESAHLSASLTSGDTDYKIEQYYATKAGQTYVVTFAFSSSVSDADRNGVARSVLATWSWS